MPRSSVAGFLKFAAERDWKKASEYLDLRRLPKGYKAKDHPKLARQFKLVLDDKLWIAEESLSLHPLGRKNDALPKYQDRVGVIDIPNEKVEILLQRVPRKDRVLIWKFSNSTVLKIPLLFEHYGSHPLRQKLLPHIPQFDFLGFESWQWVSVLGLLIISWFGSWIPTACLAWVLKQRKSIRYEHISRFIAGPIRFLIFVLLAREGLTRLSLGLQVEAILRASTVLILATTWVLVLCTNIFFSILSDRAEARQLGSSVLLRPLRKLAHVVLIVGAFVFWLDNLGINVTTLVAGLGIGGVAIAFAAQKSLEDIFGALTLYTTSPVRVGDFCRFEGTLGSIEEIGLRWTKVRTLEDTVLSIPNGEFVKLRLENFAQRRKIWYHPRVQLRYDTTEKQIERILEDVHGLLQSHPQVLPDPARIRFVGFGQTALNLDVFAYVECEDYNEFLRIAEKLNLDIMTIVKKNDAHLARPDERLLLNPEGESPCLAKASNE